MSLKKDNDNAVLVFDIDIIKQKVADSIRKPVATMEDLERFFYTWFCLHYELPYKNDILEKYTLTDLIFEYYDVLFRTNPKELESYCPLEEQKKAADEDEEWVKSMEGDNIMSADEQGKMLEQAHKEVIRPEIALDANGNPIAVEEDGMPEDFKHDFGGVRE